MTAELTPDPNTHRLTAESLQRVRFTAARSRGRGYDEAEVDAVLSRCAHELDALHDRIRGLEEQNRRLQESGNGRGDDDVFRSVSVLMQAQRTADTTVAQADEYSARVMAEARTMYENARRKATEIVDSAHDMAQKAAADKGEVEREATYLRTLRDVTRTQIETFLEGLLNHLASEYGRAAPDAVTASTQRDSYERQRDSYERSRGGDGNSSVTHLRTPETSVW